MCIDVHYETTGMTKEELKGILKELQQNVDRVNHLINTASKAEYQHKVDGIRHKEPH